MEMEEAMQCAYIVYCKVGYARSRRWEGKLGERLAKDASNLYSCESVDEQWRKKH